MRSVAFSLVQDVARGMAVLRQPFALQRPVHGLDDVATFTKLSQHRLGLWRHHPFAGLDLSRQPHALQLARPLDQQRPVLAERVAHVLVGAQVGELPLLLLGDQHPVEPGETIGIHLPLKLSRHLKLGLPAQFQRDDFAGALANAVGDIVAGDIEGLAVLGDAAQEDMGVRVAGVVVVDRDPVELRPEIGFHLLHQVAGGLARVGQLRAVLGRDDEAEMVPVLTAPVEEGTAILHIALSRIDLALLAIPRHAVPFEVAQVRVYCLGADKLPSAGGSVLRAEFHHPSLHSHPPRPSAHAAPVSASRAPIFEQQRRCGAPAPRVEPAACLPGPGSRVRDCRQRVGSPDGPHRRSWSGVRTRRSGARFLPPPRSRTLPGRIRKSSSLRAMRRRSEVETRPAREK